MTQKNLRRIISAVVVTWLLIFVGIGIARAAFYNIQSTDYFVNGLPPTLTKAERAKLITAPVTMTEKSCLALKCTLLDKAKAKVKIKEIIAAENNPIPIPAKCLDGTIGTPPNCVTPPAPSLIPIVDVSKYMKPAIGYDSLRITSTTEVAPNSGGEFRIGCKVSHFNNDDVLLYPNQQGAAHAHQYFGNTSTNYKTDVNNIFAYGNSTCSGGTMNKSAYWTPPIINIETNAPVLPSGDLLVYYKSGAIDGSLIKPLPKGIRMIGGNMKAQSASETGRSSWTCHPGPNSKRQSWPKTAHIPQGKDCEPGDDLMATIEFGQCWDGKNLDSPNHMDHLKTAIETSKGVMGCPVSHPVPIPQIGINVHYIITDKDDLSKWRLSSDNYQFNGKNAGYSLHADLIEGWNREWHEKIIKNCINAKKDAHAHLTCSGEQFY